VYSLNPNQKHKAIALIMLADIIRTSIRQKLYEGLRIDAEEHYQEVNILQRLYFTAQIIGVLTGCKLQANDGGCL